MKNKHMDTQRLVPFLVGVVLLSSALFAQVIDPEAYALEVAGRVDADRLAAYHELLASEPHLAGTAGDRRTIERIEELMRSFGLEVTRQRIWVYLASPVDASVRVLPAGEAAIELPLRERALAEDEWTQRAGLPMGLNGYSGSGSATGEVVYANYGRLEDFKKLKELGIDCTGKIVIARYGGNFRGFKAKFAQEAGAAGLIIYMDPADSGYVKGIEYPEGGYGNGSSIQRGSLATLDYSGDPLTPFIEATEDAPRLDPDDVPLPKIPVQPIGWDAANEIISRMRGARVPDAWQGGLPTAYRLTGGAALRVEVTVEQERRVVETANVIGELRGAVYPDEIVLVGCHHDAWGYGASDPMAGMICLLEAARSFAEAAKAGHSPARTIRFAAWGAEEQGIIGSTEYVEANAAELTRGAVAYINLDGAAMGPNLSASGAPSLAGVVAAAAGGVAHPGDSEKTALEAWLGRKPDLDGQGVPRLGDLGGGSDHVGFNCYLAVASLGLHGSGSRGTAYHTNYDTIAWYRKVVGGEYASAMMVTQMTIGVAARLAGATIVPMDPSTYGAHTVRHLEAMEPRVSEKGLAALGTVRAAATEFGERAGAVMERLGEAEVSEADAVEINARLRAIERLWADGFDTGRSWFRSGYASSDQSSGYAAWMLPGLRHAVELGDEDLLAERAVAYVRYFDRAGQFIDEIDEIIE